MNRAITKRQEQVYRMRHHDFGGMSSEATAKALGVGMRVVRKHMLRLKHVAPQLFPILTQRQALIYRLYVEKGLFMADIASALGIVTSTVSDHICKMRKKGMLIPHSGQDKWFFGPVKMRQYQSFQDVRIVKKF